MSIDIFIGNFKAIKPHSCNWNRSIENFSDSAKIAIPALMMLKKEGDTYEKVATGLKIEEGMKVEIKCGYNGNKVTRFKGFVSRINFNIPLELECEGYSYQLRKVTDFTKSYSNTTVKDILQDLIVGTDISLSDAIPQIPLEKVVFKNASGIQVLEWFKDKCLLTSYFNNEVLYVGAEQLEPKSRVKLRLGWNTIKDSELKFNNKKQFAEVKINIVTSQKGGKKKKASAGSSNGNVKQFKTLIKDDATLSRIAEEERKKYVNKGYEGSVLCFLAPYAEPGMAAEIEDTKYPDRSGNYFITGVSGDFSPSGGRQKVKIGNRLG